MNKYINRSLMFSLSVIIIIADQISKKLIVDNIMMNTIGHSFWNGFLRIVHVRNLGAAFSMGDSIPNIVRIIILIILPLIVMVGLGNYIAKTENMTTLQLWCLAGILGGGLGNLVDRIFRPDGVVDFIDVKFYGILGWERFPTFNIADSSIVVFGIILLITFIIEGRKKNEQKA